MSTLFLAALKTRIADHRIAQQQGGSPSLSSLDRRIGLIFFIWDVFNVFLGAMLGGSIFSQLGVLIKDPGSIAKAIGGALTTSSNFFINYIILQVETCHFHDTRNSEKACQSAVHLFLVVIINNL